MLTGGTSPSTTVATRLDEAGISARQVADQLGHRNPVDDQRRLHGPQDDLAAAATILGRRKPAGLSRSRPEAALSRSRTRLPGTQRAQDGQRESP